MECEVLKMIDRLNGSAGVVINTKDVTGLPAVPDNSYKIGLVGWTPQGPTNKVTLVSSVAELYSMFGTPTSYDANAVQVLHAARILLDAGAKVQMVRAIEGKSSAVADHDRLNYASYNTAASGVGTITVPTSGLKAPVGYCYNLTEIEANGIYSISASSEDNSKFTAFLKYPGFDKYAMTFHTFQEFVDDSDLIGEKFHTLNVMSGDDDYSSEVSEYKNFVTSLGLYDDYALNAVVISADDNVDVSDVYYVGTKTSLGAVLVNNVYYTKTVDAGKPQYSIRMYGDRYVDGAFHRFNGEIYTDAVDSTTLNVELNAFIELFGIVRVYTSVTKETPIETLYVTLGDYITTYGDQLNIENVDSSLLLFKINKKYIAVDSITGGITSKVALAGGAILKFGTETNRNAYTPAWYLFKDIVNIDVRLLCDAGSSINAFGLDADNTDMETVDISTVKAMLEVSTWRMDAPSIIDLPKTKAASTLVKKFLRQYPSIGAEVQGNTAQYETFWGNAQDGRNIIFDLFNKKQIECARSVFKALVTFNVATTTYPWQTCWGPNRGLIGSPSVGSLNHRLFPDGTGLLSKNRINPSKTAPTGEFFWDDWTMMAKSSVLQRWHAVTFLADLYRRYRTILEQYVAELNTPDLRATIFNVLNEDLNYIKNIAKPAGVYDYYVICDETNNTPDVIDRERLIVDIGLEIVRDTRVIELNNTLYRTGGIVKSGIKLG